MCYLVSSLLVMISVLPYLFEGSHPRPTPSGFSQLGKFADASLTISTNRFTNSLSQPAGGSGKFFGGIELIQVRLSKRHCPIFPGVNLPFRS